MTGEPHPPTTSLLAPEVMQEGHQPGTRRDLKADAPLLELDRDEGGGRGHQDEGKLEQARGPGCRTAAAGAAGRGWPAGPRPPEDRGQQERIGPAPRVKKLSRSDRTARAWPSWSSARVVNTIVCHGQPAPRAPASRARQTAAMVSPTQRACRHSPRAKIDVTDHGGRRRPRLPCGPGAGAVVRSPAGPESS